MNYETKIAARQIVETRLAACIISQVKGVDTSDIYTE